MYKVALYGKGGIGKSTVSSNISYVLSSKGYSVCHIGCDPKHDSTKSITIEKNQRTVLDVIRDYKQDVVVSDLVSEGLNGICCIEVGGPEPGIGCAGHGMVTAFDKLNKLGFKSENFDVVLYDVLGDVVCGGFAVPLRKDNADAVYIITSGEFMSMYAANNIMKGILNFSEDHPRVAGLILNKRGLENEYERVKRFADAVGVPIIASIDRDEHFRKSEVARRPISQLYPDSEPVRAINEIVDNLAALVDGRGQLYCAKPLNDEQLEQLASGRPITGSQVIDTAETEPFDLETKRNLLKVCATKGAAVMVVSGIKDLQIIIHGPKSCGHMINTAITNHRMPGFNGDSLDYLPLNKVHCTCMDEVSSIYGGIPKLEEQISELLALGKKNFVIITTCVSGMLGDDIKAVADRVSKENPDVTVIDIPADGVMSGDDKGGRIIALNKLLDLICVTNTATIDGVTLFDEFYRRFESKENRESIDKIFGLMGLKLNLKLFEDCSVEEIIGAKKNRFTVMARDSDNNKIMKAELEKKGISVYENPLPKGIPESKKWIAEFTAENNIDGTRIRTYLDSICREYQDSVKKNSHIFSGKKVGIYSTTETDFEWVLNVLKDLNIDITGIAVTPDNSSNFLKNGDYEKLIKKVKGKDLSKTISGWNADYIIGDMALPGRNRKNTLHLDYNGVFCDPSLNLIDKLLKLNNNKREGWKEWGI